MGKSGSGMILDEEAAFYDKEGQMAGFRA